MRMKSTILVLAIIVLLSCSSYNLPVKVASPDGKVAITLALTEEGAPVYSVSYSGKEIISPSPLGIEFKTGGLLSTDLKVKSIKKASADETYEVIAGKSKQARNHYNEITVSLQEQKQPKRKIDLVFRAYDDGVAFRYVIPKQKSLQEFQILSEKSEFRFPTNSTCWALKLKNFQTNYESEFLKTSINDIQPDDIVGMPLTIGVNDSLTISLTEANLTDYAGMYLSGAENAENALISRLSPLPDGNGVCVKASAPHPTPWRVIMIGEEPGDLIESNIIINLNEPCAIQDPSWIKPGKTAWDWWSGQVVKGVDFESGMNTKTMEYYIDFAGEVGLEYMLIDAEWYGDHKDPNADITTPIPEIDMPHILKHAKEKNVGVLLWLNWECVDRQMDEAFPLYEKWGIKGVKIDYMNRDDQEMVNFYHKVVKKAAEHHLLVDFHGAYKPTGFRRTFPNLITREGIMGLEYNKWSNRITPEHNVTIPFTRMLTGPMDYTPGAFRNVTKEQFKAQRIEPMAMGTRCHQLAMYVVYESPLQMLSDHPAAYRGQPGLEFLKVVPTTWDETKVLYGKIGEYVCIARKHGDDWFIGAMTNWDPRSLDIPLDFLGEGEYQATIFADGPGADRHPTRVSVTTTKVSAQDKLTANLAPGGGYAMYLSPVK